VEKQRSDAWVKAQSEVDAAWRELEIVSRLMKASNDRYREAVARRQAVEILESTGKRA
jgi:hypothetical protein